MNYKITSGEEFIRDIFEALKNNHAVKFSYLSETILNINNPSSGVVYNVGKGKINTFGRKNSALLRRFNKKIKDDKRITLEKID